MMRNLVLLVLLFSTALGLEVAVKAIPTQKLTYAQYLAKVRGFFR